MQAYKQSSAVLRAISLTDEIGDIASPQLRMMMTTYAPGKIGARHSHKGKPEVFYVLEGAIVDHRDSGSTEYRRGESCCVNEGAEHWMRHGSRRAAGRDGQRAALDDGPTRSM